MGGYGFFDAQGNKYSGDNSFMNSLTDALNSLRAGKVGNTLVGELMNSSNIVILLIEKLTVPILMAAIYCGIRLAQKVGLLRMAVPIGLHTSV